MPGCGNQKTITPLSLDGRDNANEWKESLLFVSRVQLICHKDNEIFHMKNGLFRFFDVMIKKRGKYV